MTAKTFMWLAGAVILVGFGVLEYNFYQERQMVSSMPTATTTPTTQALEYRNDAYGFVVPLPESWRGFTVSEKVQDGYKLVSIKHPSSTTANPRMDVPILVVPLETWNTWYPPGHPDDGQHPFAAPVPATERARNNLYVFATAPRYNFSYLPGFEEVDLIVQKVTAFSIGVRK